MRASQLHLPVPQSAADFVVPVLLGIGAGVLQRWLLLRSDYRQFPSHPHGRVNFLFLGFLASVLGALAGPAILTFNVTAGVFLAIGAGQFHTIRDLERQMLAALDASERVPRGPAYIEGMAITFESRNYLTMTTAMAVTVAAVFGPVWAAVLVAAGFYALWRHVMAGPLLTRIADVRTAEVRAEGGRVSVGGLTVLADLEEAVARRAAAEGVGLWIAPRTLNDRITLAGRGQQQAILHDLTVRLGLRVTGWEGEPLLPRSALDPRSGAVAVFLVPEIRDPEKVVAAARLVPVLEITAHRPFPRGNP